jgi:hypothetical protein
MTWPRPKSTGGSWSRPISLIVGKSIVCGVGAKRDRHPSNVFAGFGLGHGVGVEHSVSDSSRADAKLRFAGFRPAPRPRANRSMSWRTRLSMSAKPFRPRTPRNLSRSTLFSMFGIQGSGRACASSVSRVLPFHVGIAISLVSARDPAVKSARIKIIGSKVRKTAAAGLEPARLT